MFDLTAAQVMLAHRVIVPGSTLAAARTEPAKRFPRIRVAIRGAPGTARASGADVNLRGSAIAGRVRAGSSDNARS